MVNTVFNFRRSLSCVLAGFLSVAATSAMSASYDIAATCTTSNVATCNVSDMTVSAWSNATSSGTAGSVYVAAKLYSWASGVGIVNAYEDATRTGPHAVDNKYGNDSMMFRFNAASNVSALTIGWDGTDNPASGSYNDSDLAIYYWSGSVAPVSTGTPATLSSPTTAGAGWTLVGNYCNVGSITAGSGNDTLSLSSASRVCTGQTSSYSASTYSSYWLVTGYGTSTTPTKSFDAFKMVSLSASTAPGCTSNCNQVPEPGTLALVGLATLGLAGVRRRSGRSPQ